MNEPVISGWHEALLSVSDLDAWVRVYAEVGEWEVRHERVVSTDVIEYPYRPARPRVKSSLVERM